ncbi:MAG: hypothetical protein C4288_09120 [Leptolyngbya sp. ERB_1_1]
MLLVRRVRGALLWGILITAGLAWIFRVTAPPTAIFAVPELPRDIFGRAITGLTQLNASNFVDSTCVANGDRDEDAQYR